MMRFATIPLALAVLGTALSFDDLERSGPAQLKPSRNRPVEVAHARTPDELRKLVREKHAEGSLIITRQQWPRDVPLGVGLGIHRSYFTAHYFVVEFADCQDKRLTSVLMPPAGYQGSFPSGPWNDEVVDIPTVCVDDDGNVQLRFRVQTQRDRDTALEPLSFSVELVDSVDDLLTPVVDEQIDQRLSEGFSVALYAGFPDSPPDTKVTFLMVLPSDLPSDRTFAFKIELLNGDEVVATGRFCGNEKFRHFLQMAREDDREAHLFHVATDMTVAQLYERAEGRSLRVRITSDPEYALRDFKSDKYWQGSFIKDVEWHPWDPWE